MFVFGVIIDRRGKRAHILTMAGLIMAIAHIINAFIPPTGNSSSLHPLTGTANYIILLPLVLIGIGNSLIAASAFAAITIAVNPMIISLSFGVAASGYNIGISIVPTIVGAL